MNTLKRWYHNIQWLLNRPPTGHTISKQNFKCDYCDNNGVLNFEDKIRFCSDCLKKALDKALKRK